MMLTPDTPLLDFPGVGVQRAKKLEKLGLTRAGDLLGHYPRDYEDRRTIYTIREAPLGERVCIAAMAAEQPHRARIRRGLDLVQVKVVDQFDTLYLTFFNQEYTQWAIQAGEEYIFFGSVEVRGRHRAMTNPIFEPMGKQSDIGRIMPIYPLTAGISNHMMASLVRQALPCAAALPESLPAYIRQEHSLSSLEYALQNIHFPQDEQALALAKRRLVFDELFYLSVGLSYLKRRREDVRLACAIPQRPREEFLRLLPFAPTAAQLRVMDEIAFDLSSGRPMNRLIQGDVGSGKTAVAAYAGWLCAKAGYQCALMAPTEVLSEQHYRSLSALLSPAGVRVGLLTGSLNPGEKKTIHAQLAAGEIDLVVGTHALISQGVEFHRLALIIADEQHRFGVAQRSALAGKSETGGMPPPHVLVMSATPIPRTLALIIYGDLDISVINELPPGRTPVETYVVREDKRQRMYQFVRKQVAQGRQVYIICPAVEESPEPVPGTDPRAISPPAAELKAVKTYTERLQKEIFPDLTLGFLYGKMKPREKDKTMAAFARGEIQVLVSTTVVEVGVDVPNASLIIIENADRFGLSQLHQLRGRVGRGKHQSYCVLITSTRSVEAMTRLRTLASTTDGFRISEEDLKARGPGDFFGSRQHGLPQMKLADLAGDMVLLQEAQQAAQALLTRDPALSQPDSRPVLQQVRRMFTDTPDIFN